MLNRPAVLLTPERSAVILDEAVRRVGAAIPAPVDLDALRQALETAQAKRPCSLVGLMKIGRRRALDRIRRKARKNMDRLAVVPDTDPQPHNVSRDTIDL